MDFNATLIFTRVVQVGSFTGAARGLDLPKSTVSRKLSELEERLGVRLLQRTTRKLNLTDAGRAYYRHCERIVAELEEAEQAVTRMQERPQGLLRVTAPVSFTALGPVVSEFLERHRQVQVELVCTDRVVDLVEEGFDLAIRAGRLADSTLVARRLGEEWRLAVASPAYLEGRGTPAVPADLPRHDCLVFGAGQERANWQLEREREQVTVPVPARLVVNDFQALRNAALSGQGIAMIPVRIAAEDLEAGRLIRVLPEWRSPLTPIHAVYPSRRHLSPKVAAFLERLQEHMTPAHGWSSSQP